MSTPSVNLQKPEATPWLELFVNASPDGHVTATVPVRWHIHPDLVTKIGARGFTNPHLLIVVRSLKKFDFGDTVEVIDHTNTSAYVVPLTQELQFVNFTRPGSNEIVATIIDVTKTNADQVRRLQREIHRIYLDDEGRPDAYYFQDYKIPYIFTGATQAVEVPREMFAPDPKPWKKRLVKAFFPSWEDDQCHFRRRLIGAFFMAIGVQLYGLFARPVIALWLLYFGYRKVEWSRLWNINPHALINQRDKKEGTWWTRDKHGNQRSPWWKLISPLAPIIAFAAPALVFVVAHIFKDDDGQPIVAWGWWETVIIIDLAIVAIFIAIGIISLGLMVWDMFAQKMRDEEEARSSEATTAALCAAEQERLLASLRAMSLNRDPRATVSALPKGKQTIVLRFYDLKARVCRPFAR